MYQIPQMLNFKLLGHLHIMLRNRRKDLFRFLEQGHESIYGLLPLVGQYLSSLGHEEFKQTHFSELNKSGKHEDSTLETLKLLSWKRYDFGGGGGQRGHTERVV